MINQKTEEKILRLMHHKSDVTTKEIAKLKKVGYVRRIGGDKGGLKDVVE